MKRVYIATQLDNAKAAIALRDRLAGLGIGVTYDWTVHGSVKGSTRERIREVEALEKAGVRMADLVVVLLPGGRGTHAELGLAIAWEIPVLLVAERNEQVEVTAATSAFYWDPVATRCRLTSPRDIASQVVAMLAANDVGTFVRTIL